MIRVGQWSVGILLTAMILVGGVAGVSRAQSVPDTLQATGLDVCNARPCFMTIVPNVTLWQEARSHLEKLRPQASDSVIALKVDDIYAEIVRPPTRNGVGDIKITRLSGRPVGALGSFIQTYGAPCAVMARVDYDGAWWSVLYPYMELELGPGEGRLEAESGVMTVFLGSETVTRNDRCTGLRSLGLDMIPWIGFASLDTHKRHGLIPIVPE